MFHDIVWQVWGNRVSLLAGQIVHRSLILVVQRENFGNQLQLLHFGRIAAVLLDVGQIGRSDPYHFRHFAERDLFLCAFLLKELSKILVLCVHVVHLFYCPILIHSAYLRHCYHTCGQLLITTVNRISTDACTLVSNLANATIRMT